MTLAIFKLFTIADSGLSESVADLGFAKFRAYTGRSMLQTQKYPLAPGYHLLVTSSEDVACQYSAT